MRLFKFLTTFAFWFGFIMLNTHFFLMNSSLSFFVSNMSY